MLTLSLKDRDRLVVLRQVQQGDLTSSDGARRLGLSARHFRRLLARFLEEGDEAVIHRSRGRPSNRRVKDEIRLRALVRAREPHFHDFAPTLLAEHLSRDPDIGPLSPHSLRRWLMAEGLWTLKPKGRRYRKARPRRAAFGELIQVDGSIHPWLEDRHPEPFTLLKAVDDATNRIQFARFVPRETGSAHRQLLLDYLTLHGRPRAIYTDRAACFGQYRRPRTPRESDEEKEAEHTRSIIRLALQALDVELILANSPQAKGRIERSFGTSQDRLVKELRLQGVCTLEAANRYLSEAYVPFWNERFVVDPAEPGDLHRPLPSEVDLFGLFAETEVRRVINDFTFRYKNQRFQIPKALAGTIKPKDKITVERRLDGTVCFHHRGMGFTAELAAQCAPPRPPKPERRGGARPVPKNHPWKRSNMVFAVSHDTPTAPQPALSSPTTPK